VKLAVALGCGIFCGTTGVSVFLRMPLAFPSRAKLRLERALTNIHVALILNCGKPVDEFEHRLCLAPMIQDEDRDGQLGRCFLIIGTTRPA
jgi:hypothetical protein